MRRTAACRRWTNWPVKELGGCYWAHWMRRWPRTWRDTSRILPPYMRRSPKVAEVLPILYCEGSRPETSSRRSAHCWVEDAAGLSATNIARLTAVWEQEYRSFRNQSLAERDYVYIWADGIHFRVRLEQDRLCTLVIIGARPDGTKELLAIEDGYRESAECWLSVLRCLKSRGASAGAGDRRRGPWGSGTRSARCGPRRSSSATGATSLPTCWTSSRSAYRARPRPCCTR